MKPENCDWRYKMIHHIGNQKVKGVYSCERCGCWSSYKDNTPCMKQPTPTEKAKVIWEAVTAFAFIGSYHPDEHPRIIRQAKLAASALLELQGVAKPTAKQINDILTK